MTLLAVDRLSAGYGDFQALFDVSISVDEGETIAIIGANGSGKSTLMGAIAGAVSVRGGRIAFAGRDLRGVPPEQRLRAGIALVPEGRRLFPSLTARENLLIGAYAGRTGQWDLDEVLALFPFLAALLERGAGFLSGGERQAVAIGRALMANPRLLLLDEASLGLAPIVVRSIYEALPRIRAGGTTVLVVEQDITQALAVASRVYCLLEGRVSLEGAAADVDRDMITAAYFGTLEDRPIGGAAWSG